MDEQSIIFDPLFVDAASGDLRLQEVSPARDAGAPGTDLSLFPKNESDVPRDLESNPCVNNGRRDIGAYEYHSRPTHVDIFKDLPEKVDLHQNYPNPVNPSTIIRYSLPERSAVELTVIDMLGRVIVVLFDDELSPGEYEVKFEAGNLSSGVYLYRLQVLNRESGGAGPQVYTRKMVLIK